MKLTNADWSNVREVVPGQPVPAGALAADPGPAAAKFVTQPLPLRGPQGKFFETPRALAVSAATGWAVLGHIDDGPGSSPTARFEWCDLTAGRTLGSQTVPDRAVPLALSPDGRRLLARAEGHMFGEKMRLDVWSLAADKLEHVVSWRPAKTSDKFQADVLFADWADDAHVVAVTRDGKLTLWTISPPRAVYTLPVQVSSRAALSPGRKYLAVETSGGLELYRPLDGELVGRLTDEAVDQAGLAFRPDGAQLAVLSPRRLQVWEVAGGTQYRDIAVPTVDPNARLDWTDPKYVLLEGKHLVDIERRMVLWEYGREDARDTADAVAGGVFWYVATDRQAQTQRLVPVKLPHDEAAQAATGLDPESLLAIKPGVSVSLEVQLEATAEQRETIRQTLTAQLERNGVKVAQGQAIQLAARTVAGESKEISYRSFGTPPWGNHSKVTYTEQRCELQFLVHGRSVWRG